MNLPLHVKLWRQDYKVCFDLFDPDPVWQSKVYAQEKLSSLCVTKLLSVNDVALMFKQQATDVIHNTRAVRAR
jgi:hypothetical protein